MGSGLTNTSQKPNYLDFISLKALDEIKTETITIIR